MLPNFRIFEYDGQSMLHGKKCALLLQEPLDKFVTQPDDMFGNLIRVTRRGYQPICKGDLRAVLRFIRASLGGALCPSTDRLVFFYLMSCNFVAWERHPRPTREFPYYGHAFALWDFNFSEDITSEARRTNVDRRESLDVESPLGEFLMVSTFQWK